MISDRGYEIWQILTLSGTYLYMYVYLNTYYSAMLYR